MEGIDWKSLADSVYQQLRLRSFPVAARLSPEEGDWPEKTRRPSQVMGKRITICQAMTLARVYGWTVGLAREDMICVPSMLAFGQTGAKEPKRVLGRFFCKVEWTKDEESAATDLGSMSFLEKGRVRSLVLSPLQKGLYHPDTIAVYGNPAQIMRLVQAWSYMAGKRVDGEFGGKVECTEYLIAPYILGRPRIAIPGNGDRVMSMTQDDELVFALPGKDLPQVVEGLARAGRALGARYPVPFYQNFQPEFPKVFGELAREADAE